MTSVEQHRPLKSSNPILSGPQFRRRGGRKTAARDARAGLPVVRSRRGADQDLEHPHQGDDAPFPFLVAALMTMDDVLTRAAVGLAVTALAAVLSWTLLSHVSIATGAAYAVAAGAGSVAATLVVVQRRRNLPSPTLALTFAFFQGVFLAVLSTTLSGHLSPGVLVQMVMGTMAAFAGVLLAHACGWVRAHRRFFPFVGAGLSGVCVLALADWFLLPVMGADGMGLRPGGLGVFTGTVGVLLSTSFLSLHLRKVEDGIAGGADRAESWTAAFGLTLTLGWLYVETVRLFTLFPGEEFY